MGPVWQEPSRRKGERRIKLCCHGISAVSANPTEEEGAEFRKAIRTIVDNLTQEDVRNGNVTNDCNLYMSIHYLFLLILQHIMPWENLFSELTIHPPTLLQILSNQIKSNHNKYGEGEWCLTPIQLRQIASRVWSWLVSTQPREHFQPLKIIPKEDCPQYAWNNGMKV